MSPQHSLGSFLTLLIVGEVLSFGVSAQCIPNGNTGCQTYATPQPFSTVYYAPDDNNNIQITLYTNGQCDAGSSAAVAFFSGVNPSGRKLADCGCIPLSTSANTIDCNGVSRSSLPEGSYYFTFDSGNYHAYDPFTITHSQSTVVAGTPTVVATSSSTSTSTTTTTSIIVSTSTGPQDTVTSPASYTTQTSTVTPIPVTTTTTLTKTYSKIALKFTVKKTTKTVIAQCTSRKPCPTAKAPSRLFRKRSTPNNVGGDGPLTTTVYPDPVTTTTTVDGGTVTETDTAYTTTTTTVPPTPLTTTVYTGVGVTTTTTTLPAKTSTVTKRTSTRVTKTLTVTLPYTVTSKTTPVCTKK